MGGISEYDFPNGLRVLLYPDAANPKGGRLVARPRQRNDLAAELGNSHIRAI